MARQDPGQARDRAIVRVARAYVHDCCRAQTSAHVNELAARVRLSRTQVTRAIKRETGRTASHYLRYLRIVRACVLLRAGLTTQHVAYLAGFGTRASLFRVFKKETGMTPEQYRQQASHL